LLSRGILPSVYLMAVDDRILKYKHASRAASVLKNYAMLNLCARKWGLTVSITRFAHFGALPAELSERFPGAAQVNAALLDATRVGATGELFRVAADAYAHNGFAGDEQLHHQGGATGYGSANGLLLQMERSALSTVRPLRGTPAFAAAKWKIQCCCAMERSSCSHRLPSYPRSNRAPTETAIRQLAS
jgi:Xaa-Pro dipeptidase